MHYSSFLCWDKMAIVLAADVRSDTRVSHRIHRRRVSIDSFIVGFIPVLQ